MARHGETPEKAPEILLHGPSAAPAKPRRFPGENYPHVSAGIPGLSLVIAEHRVHTESGALEPARHLRNGERSKHERKSMSPARSAPLLDVFLIENGEPLGAILP